VPLLTLAGYTGYMPSESGPRALLLSRASTDPDRTAFVEGATGQVLTWGDLRASLEGWDLVANSVGARRRVGLLAAEPLETVRGFLGALAAGVLVAPLDPGATSEELEAASRRLGLAALVTDATTAASVADLGRVDRWVTGALGPSPVAAGDRSCSLRADDDAALLMASSGTTGDPKVIPLTARQLLDTARAVAGAHGLDAFSTGYSPLPLFHINGLVVGVLSTLVTGGRLVVDRRFSAGRFWAVVADHEVTWLNLVPAIIGILAAGKAPDAAVLEPVRFARSASAPLPTAVREAFERRYGIGVVETYGMTEAASQICANPADPAGRRPGTVGRPVDVALRVIGDDGTPAGPGRPGEVQISGSRVVARYWTPGRPGTRPATGADGWLATGDLGHLDADGYLTLTGRVDDVINRGGEKVFPREVEEVLLADPAVASAAVVGRPDEVVGFEPVAYVIARPDAKIRPSDLVVRLGQLAERSLSRYKRPAQIVVTASLPSGPTGKIKHSALRRAVAEGTPPAPVEGTGAADGEPATASVEPGVAPACTAPGPLPDRSSRPAPACALRLPPRTSKPRSTGLTMVIDGGQPTQYFIDAIRSAAGMVDVVKFGWGTAVVSPDLDVKIAALRDLGIRYYFGGTLFEKYVTQGQFGAFCDFVESKGCDTVEISNGTIPMANPGKAAYIRKAADRFHVVSEVGFKDSARSERLSPSMWIDAIEEDLEAGAQMVIGEARESGSSGICRSDGELRFGLVEDILLSGVDTDKLLWEAPNKTLQAYFVGRIGANVNMGNIAVDQVIGVETLRLGLRSETLLHVERELSEHDGWQQREA
jgi:acyl-CoA synthetase (AMP-forming)/AMP-acid ligase II/phosphosulfolactate synthase (CoM biosynthesis protein A)